jgi:CBS domain containing-hemolysin-like protein
MLPLRVDKDRLTAPPPAQDDGRTMTSDDSSTGAPASTSGAAGAEARRDSPGEGLFDRLLALVGLRQPASIRNDLQDALSENGAGADFSPQERAMLQNVLALRTRRVDDVMVPRADIVAVPLDIRLGDLLRVFRTAGHSRLPVYAETLDDPRGMVHIRDFLDYLATRAETARPSRRRKMPLDAPDLGKVDLATPLAEAKILRPVLFVPPSMPALDLLVKMQTVRTHMALVIDEYGGTDGLVSMEDIVEIVVGDIEDEHDEDETPALVRTADGALTADARASLEDVSEALGLDVAHDELAEDVDTLGGLISTLAGRVPVRGEMISHPNGLEFEVIDADARRIKRVRIHTRAGDPAPAAPEVKLLPAPAPEGAPPASAALSDKADGP